MEICATSTDFNEHIHDKLMFNIITEHESKRYVRHSEAVWRDKWNETEGEKEKERKRMSEKKNNQKSKCLYCQSNCQMICSLSKQAVAKTTAAVLSLTLAAIAMRPTAR